MLNRTPDHRSAWQFKIALDEICDAGFLEEALNFLP
jgi:hypothetical protein